MQSQNLSNTKSINKVKKRKLLISSFIEKLYNILEVSIEQENRYKEIISWNDKGDSVLIYDKHKMEDILPLIFKTNNYNSFVRQLNIYTFKKIKNKMNIEEFKNIFFKKNNKDELFKIQRIINGRVDINNQKKLLKTEIDKLKVHNKLGKDSYDRLIQINQTILENNDKLALQYNIYKNETEKNLQTLLLKCLKSFNHSNNVILEKKNSCFFNRLNKCLWR